MSKPFLAHSAYDFGRVHTLEEHLSSVGRMAAESASGAPWKSEAELAGLLHDLGKCGDSFQRRLESADSGLDHWTAGAHVVSLRFGSLAAALAIDGCHIFGVPLPRMLDARDLPTGSSSSS
jgi:CRISPR-associated endonuclease/helicase Cas3